MLFPIDTARLQVLIANPQVREAAEYDGETRKGQARNAQGVPLWTADVMLIAPDGAELIRVKFPAATAPDLGAPMTPVKVTGLTVRHLREKIYFSADGLVPARGSQQG